MHLKYQFPTVMGALDQPPPISNKEISSVTSYLGILEAISTELARK